MPVKTKRLPHCYVAGPMRGLPKFNFPAFDAARDAGIAKGFEITSPADLDRASGFHEDAPPMDAMGPKITREFVRRDTKALLSFRAEKGDAIALLPGWEKSTGAVSEFFIARWLGLRILDARTFEPFTDEAMIALDMTTFQGNVLKTLKQGSL